MKAIFTLAFVFAATLLSGCMPAYFVRVPALEGRVVDAQGKPVPDATVIVESIRAAREIARFKVEPDGRFFRRDEGSWGIFIIGMDFMRLDYSLKAVAGGETSAAKDFSGGWAKVFGLGDSVKKFGDIRLP